MTKFLAGLKNLKKLHENNTHTHGFTLVELSIVLVIIGLLISGVLVGHSLIESAKINAQVQQFQQFDAATMGFKAKYKGLPGDSISFGGDGDGSIDLSPSSGADNAITVFACEIANFWSNMNQALYAASTCTTWRGFKPVTQGAGRNAPASKLGSNGSFFIASGIGGSNSPALDTANRRNYYAIMARSQSDIALTFGGSYHFKITTASNSAVKPADLLALDQKLDDGIANTGNVISGKIGDEGDGLYGGIVSTGLATCNSGATYQTSTATETCTPLIRIGAQAGSLL